MLTIGARLTNPPTGLQSFQVGDHVVLFVVRQHFLVSRHAISTLVNFLADVGFGGLFAVVHLLVLEQALEARSHFLFGAVGVMADSTLLENFFSFFGVASLFLILAHRQRARESGTYSKYNQF